jgi:type VI secretion system secreted protein Hcp
MPIYMKLDGIEGESTDKDHDKWCDLESFSFSSSRQGHEASKHRATGDVRFSDIVGSKQVDKASTPMAKACFSGQHIKKAEVHLTTTLSGGGRQTYLVIELKDVIISSYSTAGAGDSRALEQFALNYAEIKLIYSPFDKAGKPQGKMDASWNVEAGKPA